MESGKVSYENITLDFRNRIVDVKSNVQGTYVQGDTGR